MPYASVDQLPPAVKKLSPAKQRQWMAAFNSAMKQYKNETRAFQVAFAAVKESTEGTMKNSYQELECIYPLSEAYATSTLDKENGVIKDVVLLTGNKTSANKTFYTEKAMSEAVKRYEGAKMFIDHGKDAVRSVRDLGGTYKNVRLSENFLKADLHLLPNKSVRDLVIPIAEAKPQGVGLSIRDRGKGREENGVFLVEGFSPKGPYSIDLVTEASVNRNLFEHLNDEGGDDMKISDVTLEDLSKENPALVEAIKADARKEAFKEVEEKIAKGEKAEGVLAQAKKLTVLAESGLPEKVMKAVKSIIEPETVSLELAESIIKNQKEIIESLGAGKPAPDPKVVGHGAKKDLEEGKKDLPKPEELAEAIQS
jgi:cation transport regulator